MKNKFFLFGVFVSFVSSITFYTMLLFFVNNLYERIFIFTSTTYVDSLVFSLNSNYDNIANAQNKIREILKSYKRVNYLILDENLKSVENNVSRNELNDVIRILSDCLIKKVLILKIQLS